MLVLFGLVGCREKEITGKSTTDDEKEYMKLYFNDIEIPVIWEDNQTVQELMKEAGKGDVVVQMSMYSDNEQVGSLGKSYTKNDEQITTHSGDIVLCLSETSKNPIEIIRRMMAQPFCHMHGPEHHVMVGSALLTAYKNAGGEIDLPEALLEMMNRGKAVPGGVCGFWGACGAGISTGMFISIISGATPLKNEPWGLANKMTSKALDAIGSIGGPRCCKRDSYIAIISAIDYVAENFNIQMEKPVIKCIHSDKNNQCIKERCPFHE